MKKKLVFLLVALAAAAGAHLTAAPAEAARCNTYCCPGTTYCITCCTGQVCPDLACL